MNWRLLCGDASARLRELPAQSVQTCITSPPYFGLRDYGTATWVGGDPACAHAQGRPGAGRADGIVDDRAQRNRDGVGAMGGDCLTCGATRVDDQVGLEATPAKYVSRLVSVLTDVWRVLRDDGTVWLNLGDSYARAAPGGGVDHGTSGLNGATVGATYAADRHVLRAGVTRKMGDGLKEKDLCGMPWRVAFALQDAGWYLRSDIIWSKPNPMPESVTDRPTRAHEYIFLLTKQPRYFYDAAAIREPGAEPDRVRKGDVFGGVNGQDVRHSEQSLAVGKALTRNKRSVWTVNTQPYPEAHFATFPEDLIAPCILAGSSAGACSRCGAAVTSDRLRRIRSGTNGLPGMQPSSRVRHEEQTENILQSRLRESLHCEEQGRDPWLDYYDERLSTSSEEGSSQGDVVRVCDGASRGHGSGVGSVFEEVGSGAPHQPRQAGQSSGKSRRDEETGARQDETSATIRSGRMSGVQAHAALVTACHACGADLTQPEAVGPSLVLDPFAGSGTTGVVALMAQRNFVGIELNPEYVALARRRIGGVMPLFATEVGDAEQSGAGVTESDSGTVRAAAVDAGGGGGRSAEPAGEPDLLSALRLTAPGVSDAED